MNNSSIRTMVRGSYDLQKLRIQIGNRIVGNYKSKLGQSPSMPESELGAEEKKILDKLRLNYRRITDGVADNLPSQKKFDGDELISNYTELCLLNQYFDLEAREAKHFRQLEKALEEYPVYTGFLKKVKGCGAAMSGVIISEIDIHKAKYASSLWMYCFPADTLISTPNGMIAIDHLKTGDAVFDADGKPTIIKETMHRKFKGDLCTINILGTLPLTCTDEHPVLVYRNGNEEWLEAHKIRQGDYLVLPKNKLIHNENYLPLGEIPERTTRLASKLKNGVCITQEIAYFLGMFVGDGSASIWQEGLYQRGRVALALHELDEESKDEILLYARQSFGSGSISTDGNYLSFGRRFLAEKFSEWFGHLAHDKKLPEFIMGLTDIGLIKAFLRGYFDCDGHVVKDGKSKGVIMASSASCGLIYQIQFLLTKIGIFAAVHKQTRCSNTTMIRGKVINQRQERYHLSIPASLSHKIYSELTFTGNRTARKVKSNNENYLLPVKSVVRHSTEMTVYNLHTESNTYLVQNIAVHNCGLDVAPDGKGRSKRKEHLVEQTYIDSEGKEQKKMGVTFKPFLKTKLVGVLASSFLRCKSPYSEAYYNYKNRLKTDPKHAEKSDGHIHNMAIRYCIKRFLVDLYVAWRTIEGLPVHAEYNEAKHGHVHDNLN